MPPAAPIGTTLCHAPLCPEILLALKPRERTLEAFRNAYRPAYGAAVPYWAIAWPGGQALARFLLDHPEHVAGLTVVDLGSGSGLAAIAAARAGAARVTAVDRDAHAIEAIRINACFNDVFIDVRRAELELESAMRADVALAGDLWYERFDARRATRLLRGLAEAGTRVFLGCSGRAHFPRRGVEALAAYALPASPEMEPAGEITAGVWRLLPHAAGA